MKKVKNNWPLLALALVLVGFFVWKIELLHIVDFVPSPDGTRMATVLEVELEIMNRETRPGVSVCLGWPFHEGSMSYLYTRYDGLYWSPDSKKFLLEMWPMKREAITLDLVDLEQGSSSSLESILISGLAQSKLSEHGFRTDDRNNPIMKLFFVQWNQDSTAIQFKYSFTDVSGDEHNGTFWYRLNWVTPDGIFNIEEAV